MRAAPRGGDQRELLVKFKVIKFLGKGSYGSVFLVQRLGDGQMYALKEMDVRSMSHPEREDAANEVRLLASVANPNVVRYHEAFLDGNRLCIIMEYAPDGDLTKVIKKYQMTRKPMPEEIIWKFFIQIARGLTALHSMKILHRDIKPGNIMVMQGDVAKIGDLGIAKLLKHTMAAKTQIGTPHYMPPEIWRNRPYAFNSDTWALGCIMYEMATYNVPFEARSMSELRYKVLRGTYPPVPSHYSRELQQMVRDCLDSTPEKRPTMDQILSSPSVVQRMHLLPSDVVRPAPPPSAAGLLDTIKVPRNFAMLKGKLPPAQYGAGEQYGSSDENEEPNQLPMLPPGQPVMAMKQPPVPQALKPVLKGVDPSKLPQIAAALNRAYPGDEHVQAALAGAGGYGMPKKAPAMQAQPANHAYQNGRGPGRISENHAAYGAFYNHSPAAAAAAAAAKPQGEAPKPYGGQYQPMYYNPYANPNGPQPANPRLPLLQPGRPVASPPPAAGPGARGWNYGAAGQVKGVMAGKGLPAQAIDAAVAAANGVSRYPPPQWAPKPVRW